MDDEVFTSTKTLKRPFIAAKRVNVSEYMQNDEGLRVLIQIHCVQQGKPLVLTGLDSLPGWDKDLFDLKRTLQIYGDQGIQIHGNDMDKKILPLAAYVDMLKNQENVAPCENSTATPVMETAPESPKTPSSPNQLASNTKEAPNQLVSNTEEPEEPTPKRALSDISTVGMEDHISSLKYGDNTRDSINPQENQEHQLVNDNNTPDSINFQDSKDHQPANDDNPHDSINAQDDKKHRVVSPGKMEQDDDISTTEEHDIYTGISERVQTGARRRKCNVKQSLSPPAKKLKREKHSSTSRGYTDSNSDYDSDYDSGEDDDDDSVKMEGAGQNHEREIYYAKDIDTPDEYKERLPYIVPPSLLPLGNCDLIRTLPTSLQAENLMCYLGGDRTGTALHRDISGALGHNVMTFAEEDAYAQWLVIEKSETTKLREVCQEDLGGGGGPTKKYQQKQMQTKKSYFLECERAWVSLKQLAARGIMTHVILQQPGDLVIIPSLCYHQVSNVGISFKMAWNRVTPHSLLEGIKVQLPLYNIISRPELYRCKATVYFALKDILSNIPTPSTLPSTSQQQAFLEDCRALLHLFTKDVILPEIIEPIAIENVSNSGIIQDKSPDDEEIGFDVVCDFCYSDVFYRYYHCDRCETDICLQCYATGRSCAHLDELCMHQPSSAAPNVDVSQHNDMNEFIKLYDDIVYQLNRTFGPLSIIPEFITFQHRGDSYSLATTCRRIEMYRKNNKYLSNKLYCSHCERITDLKDLRWDLKTIFEHRPCYNSLSYSLNATVFVCFCCSKKCVACTSIGSAKYVDTELVYFRDMTKNLELWGGFDDKGLYQSSYWPDFRVKLNAADTNTMEQIDKRPWTYPEDFMQLAAAELIRRIKPIGWKCWGKNELVGENKMSMADLVQRLAQEWTIGYKTVFKQQATLSNTKTYTYKSTGSTRKSKNTINISEYGKYIDIKDSSFKIPIVLLEEIVENRGRPRKYPRQDDVFEKPTPSPSPPPKSSKSSKNRRSIK